MIGALGRDMSQKRFTRFAKKWHFRGSPIFQLSHIYTNTSKSIENLAMKQNLTLISSNYLLSLKIKDTQRDGWSKVYKNLTKFV